MSGRTRKLLVVDDDEVIRSFLVEALGDEGYEVRGAADGSEALDLLDVWVPGLIILDLMMPVMDGWTFRTEQRKRPTIADVPVLILSGTHDLGTHAERLQAAGVISKPFDLAMFLSTIERLARTEPTWRQCNAKA